LKPAEGIRNIFVNDWKPNFFSSPKKRLASIPFIRNLIEYTKGVQDSDYIKLTSLLHWKSDSKDITEGDLADIYHKVFGGNGVLASKDKKVVDTLKDEAQDCLTAPQGINFENKIVLSIAIRITAEQYMIRKINDTTFVNGIKENPTPTLFSRFKLKFETELTIIKIIERVVLMTPENIHLNSFMYEPILDMSDQHLRQLYKDVSRLSIGNGGNVQ
jgi:hypothetical protein